MITLVSPLYQFYPARHYIYVFTFYYGVLMLDAIYRLYATFQNELWMMTPVLLRWWIIYGGVCTILFILTGTVPQPLHPKNLVPETGTVTIKEGYILRNDRRLSPEATASIFSWTLFQWINPLVMLGYSRPLETHDLYALTFQHLARFAHMDFLWSGRKHCRTKILFRLYHANRRTIWTQFACSTLAVVFAYAQPYYQQRFLEYFEQRHHMNIETAYGYAFAMFAAAMIRLLFMGIQLWAGRRWNVRTLCMLDSEIYAKTLRRKESHHTSTGKITNLMSVDADRIADIPASIFMFYNAPLELAIAIFYLYNLLGVASVIGLGMFLILSPISWFLIRQLRTAYDNLSSAEDRRNQLLNELFQGIRMIKYAAWESTWQSKIMGARDIELGHLKHTFVMDVAMSIGYLMAPVLVSACAFIWYVKVDNHELSASVVFVSITLFDMLRNPIMLIPDAISIFTEAYVSLKRISDYLDHPEVENDQQQQQRDTNLGFASSSIFTWPRDYDIHNDDSTRKEHSNDHHERKPLLDNPVPSLTPSSYGAAAASPLPPFQLRIPHGFDFPKNKLSLVIGSTGSGKTSLLHAVLGEMDTISGGSHRPAMVSYVAQYPFLQQTSIRDNILFGMPYHKGRYYQVLHQCALVKDLAILPDGDMTEIGEKGISLSGGQKQRVSLARAVYSMAQTILLDDCLSAVDTHTAQHIFHSCLMGDLLKDRTVVMVTHHVPLCLPAAKFLVKMDPEGRVAAFGDTDTLLKAGTLADVIGNSNCHGDDNGTPTIKVTRENDQQQHQQQEPTQDNAADDVAQDKRGEKFISEERAARGHVKLKVHATYLKACGGWPFWILLCLFFVGSRVLVFVETWWLRIWAAAYSINDNTLVHKQMTSFLSATSSDNVPVDYYIMVYVLLCLAFVVCDTVRNVLLYYGSLRGARRLFNQLLDRVIHAPMRFFDTTPIGRLLNRFGADMVVIDMQMARTASMMVECVTGMVASSIIISAITPQFIVLALITGMLYLHCSRELKRLNSISRSPIYSHFTETLAGAVTIRAFAQQRQFLVNMYNKLDEFASPFYTLWMVNRWLLVRMDTAGACMTLGATILLLKNQDTIDAGMAGISLIYARSFLSHVYWMIRQYTQVEMNLNAVERVQEYLELEQEPQGQCIPPEQWPSNATLKIRNLNVRYAPHLDPVLRNISFDVNDKEKIGVVGRTGSGKTTLGLALFRFLEASTGSILLDGIDIAHVDIYNLRSRLTMIPQDAALFSGTVRSNLDPRNEHSDTVIWRALSRVHMTSTIQSLDESVTDGGANWSQGQRQLLCMARALLQQSKLIVMDEATASIDFEMDAKIQQTIHTEFADSTLICIAHRLHTIIDYDRVLVLDQGRVVEFDTPCQLLSNPNSMFRAMCEQSGDFDTLVKRAIQ
ncbi:P-loop containing nucleoside triphosphate hydrolase protein [Lichtheimia hyalospora FSU 10163]|nr:P-loop containing nucleoside triphosphate hydrolase protein [Lichtheimia hyalospora FSU 10163]